MAGRSGASPIPPATITTSPPSAWASGQAVPNGPRTPRASPGPTRHSAFVAGPTARIVCTFGSALSEIGSSPDPNA